MRTYQKPVDWDKAKAYVAGLLPNVEKDARERLSFLKGLVALVQERTTPPRIELGFGTLGGFGDNNTFTGSFFDHLLPEKREYEKQETRVAEVVGEIANKFGLIASAGTWGILPPLSGKGKSTRVYLNFRGTFTLKPNYSQFEVEEK